MLLGVFLAHFITVSDLLMFDFFNLIDFLAYQSEVRANHTMKKPARLRSALIPHGAVALRFRVDFIFVKNLSD